MWLWPRKIWFLVEAPSLKSNMGKLHAEFFLSHQVVCVVYAFRIRVNFLEHLEHWKRDIMRSAAERVIEKVHFGVKFWSI